MTIRDWLKSERPREKLLESGATALSDAELLAIVMRCGRRGASAVDVARETLQTLGSVRALLSADKLSFCKHRGLTPTRYATLHAALELTRRHHQEVLTKGPRLNHAQATHDFLLAHLRDRPHEVFSCLYIDTRHKLIACEDLFHGSLDETRVHAREVVRRALARNAAGVIVAHNHPSGVAEPSAADELLTRRLKEALALVEIRLIDHLVVGDGYCVSFAERGLL